jgi:sugar phosphate isomerase/epimerase
MLATCASAAAVPAVSSRPAAADDGRGALGFVIHAFPVRGSSEPGFSDPARFLDHCRGLGARTIQVGLGARDDAGADALRARAEAASMTLEGIVSPPRTEADVARFEAEIRTARRAGATVVRTTMLRGRRYETFDSDASFRRATDDALRSLTLAAPLLDRHGVRLAVENHKDWRADELLGLLKRVGSNRVGVCLDTGNSIALLEDPMETLSALAPLAFTSHLKDMAVAESPDGFLLSEVPFGTGILDMPRVVRTLRSANPEIRFQIEMITRDPLKIPCLTDRYWSTFPALPGLHLARSLSFVRAHPPASPLPRISPLAPDARLRAEDENLRQCVLYAHERLGLS